MSLPFPAYEVTLWLLCVMYSAHVLEEYFLDWRNWAAGLSGLRLEWGDFHLVNAAFFVFAFGCALTGTRYPALSLALPALAAINAIGFHLLPTLALRRYSPGTVTAVLLVLPAAGLAYGAAGREGLLDPAVLLGSTGFGALAMACPVVFARFRRRA